MAAVSLLALLLLSIVASSRAEDFSEEQENAPAATTSTVIEPLPAQATNLHQWGAVTLFHGLPSDRVRAIAQDADGAMWFGTDAGLARYDGRRTQTVVEAGLASRRVLALKFDEAGRLWIGTDAGAVVRFATGEFKRVAETEALAVTAIDTFAATPEDEQVVLATNAGVIFDCRVRAENSLEARRLEDRLLLGVSAEHRASLELTSLAIDAERIFIGTRGRGLLALERHSGAFKEVLSKPRAFFVASLAREARSGAVWFGAQTTAADSGLYVSAEVDSENNLDRRQPSSSVRGPESDPARPRLLKVLSGSTGTVSALRFDARGDLLVGTDGGGVFRYRGRTRLEHFTVEETAGGLRSNHIYTIFVDREGVAWFGTDRGVCRYDARGLRNESLSTDAQSNFVRVLFQTSRGRLLAGTNRGLFVRDHTEMSHAHAPAWRALERLADKTVYTVAEDRHGMLLVGTASGLFTGVQLQSSTAAPPREVATASLSPTPAPETTEVETDKKLTDEPAVSGRVRAIALFRGAIYAAIYGRGVERLEPVAGRWRRMLISSREGEANAHTKEVVSLCADGRERLWIGTANAGVFFFDGKEVQTEPALERLKTSSVWSINGTTGAGLWLATGRGLYLYRGGSLIEVAPGLDARSVAPIQRAASALPQAWCATAGGGLLKVSMDEVFGAIATRLDAEQGLASQNVFAVLPITRAARRNRQDRSDETLQTEEGAPEGLLIGTSRGVSRYEPGDAPPALQATRITGARAHQPDELSAGINLEYPQNSLALDVAATSSRTFPEQFQYAFLLYNHAGAVVKRKLAHDSQFQIEDLKPGHYRVEARAFNVDLMPSAPLVFDLRVARAPFPWTIAGLSVLLALALVALAWGTIQNARLASTGTALREANRQLADARLQLANETEAERRRIARDLHDQTLADLRRLLLLTDEAQPNHDADVNHQPETLDPVVLRQEIESISQEIRRICEDLSPSVLENVGFAAALEWALAERVAHMPAHGKFAYEFNCDDEIEERLRFPRAVQMQIYRIVQEAVSNVCRHASAARVYLTVNLTNENDFVLLLEDDGRGFAEGKSKKVRGQNGDRGGKELKAGRGIANIRARASIIDATVRWDQRPEGGTVFTLRIDGAANHSLPSTMTAPETHTERAPPSTT